MRASGATPITGTAQAATAGGFGQGPTMASGAWSLSEATSRDAFEKPKVAWPAITVPTQVPCGSLLRLVADVTGSSVTKFSPPITVPVSVGTTGALVVPVSMTPTM